MSMGETGELSGKTLGQYEIGTLLGEGGMAAVYRAEQSSIGRTVAIKVMPSHTMRDKSFLARFEREVKVIAGLQHPRVLPVYDFGYTENRPYIVMAYLSGGTLEDRIRRGALSLSETVRLVEQMAEGLDFAHRKGIIHRDFKPANVLLDEQGNAHLADFGIARLMESTSQLTGSGMIGTAAYIAPEAISGGEITPSVDIYALGVTLYEMLAGVLPFSSNTPARLLTAHLYDPIPDVREARPDLPVGITYVIQRAMAKDPAARYPSASALAASLVDAAAGKSITPPPIGNSPVTTLYIGADGKLIRRRPMPRGVWIGVSTVALIAVIIGGMAALGMFNGASSGIAGTESYRETVDSPLLFAAATDDEVLVIVTDFEQEGVNADTRIYQGLAQKIRAKQLEGVRVERLEGVKPLLQEDAVEIGEAYGATLVIWGTADSFGIEPHYEIVRNHEAISGDVALGASSGGDATSYSAYITQGINSEFEFLMLYILGQLAIANNQPDKAVDLLGEAVSIDLGTSGSGLGLVDANMLRCKSNRELGNLDEAIEDCTTALELDPTFEPARYYRGVLYAEIGDDEAALADLNEVFDIHSTASDYTYQRRARSLSDVGQYEAALVYYNIAIELNPDNGDYYYGRADTYWLLGELELALADLNRSLELAVNDTEEWQSLSMRAIVYAQLGEYDAATVDLDRMVEVLPNRFGSYNHRAYMLIDMNIHLDQAFQDVTVALELAGSEATLRATALDTRAYLYYRQGNYDAALTDLDEALELIGSSWGLNSYINYHYAVIYDAQGNPAEALAFYLQYLEKPVLGEHEMNRNAVERVEALGGDIPEGYELP